MAPVRDRRYLAAWIATPIDSMPPTDEEPVGIGLASESVDDRLFVPNRSSAACSRSRSEFLVVDLTD
jgi:hypothetical protein